MKDKRGTENISKSKEAVGAAGASDKQGEEVPQNLTFNNEHLEKIVRAAFNSELLKGEPIPSVASTLFRSSPVLYVTALLAHLVKDRESFDWVVEAMLETLPESWVGRFDLPWPSKLGTGVAAAKELKKEIAAAYAGPAREGVLKPTEVLSLILVDVVGLALIERERQLMSELNGIAVLKQVVQ
jgi:hypothetical protein